MDFASHIVWLICACD